MLGTTYAYEGASKHVCTRGIEHKRLTAYLRNGATQRTTLFDNTTHNNNMTR
jgi:hypothetical protein